MTSTPIPRSFSEIPRYWESGDDVDELLQAFYSPPFRSWLKRRAYSIVKNDALAEDVASVAGAVLWKVMKSGGPQKGWMKVIPYAEEVVRTQAFSLLGQERRQRGLGPWDPQQAHLFEDGTGLSPGATWSTRVRPVTSPASSGWKGDEEFSETDEVIPDFTDELVDRSHDHDAIHGALADLTDEQRDAVLLGQGGLEFPIAEIADTLGVSENVVKSRQHRGRQACQRWFDKNAPEVAARYQKDAAA